LPEDADWWDTGVGACTAGAGACAAGAGTEGAGADTFPGIGTGAFGPGTLGPGTADFGAAATGTGASAGAFFIAFRLAIISDIMSPPAARGAGAPPESPPDDGVPGLAAAAPGSGPIIGDDLSTVTAFLRPDELKPWIEDKRAPRGSPPPPPTFGAGGAFGAEGGAGGPLGAAGGPGAAFAGAGVGVGAGAAAGFASFFKMSSNEVAKDEASAYDGKLKPQTVFFVSVHCPNEAEAFPYVVSFETAELITT